MTIAVLSSPSNADQLSLSFDHFQKSSFESRWNSAAILNPLCGSGAGENRKRATTYNCGESICSRCGRGGVPRLFPASLQVFAGPLSVALTAFEDSFSLCRKLCGQLPLHARIMY